MGKTSEWSEVGGEYWPQEYSSTEEEMRDKYTSIKFHDLMNNRMFVSHYKYGDTRDAYPEKVSALHSLYLRIEKYKETGNAEYLVDVANFAMIEFMHPSLPNAFFQATDSSGSPGLVNNDGSISQKSHKDKT